MTLRRRISLLVLAAGTLAFSAQAYIRTTTSAGVPLVRPDASSIQVLLNGSLTAGQTNAQGATVITASSNPQQAAAAAVAEWSQVATASIVFAPPTSTTLTNNPNDGKFVVTIEDTPANRSIVGSALAVTLFSYSGAGTIVDSDIIFNPNITQGSQVVAFSTDHTQGTYDFQSVLVHEIGHALGANHSPVISATMFQAQGACSQFTSVAECTLHQALSADDIAFATDAYPGNASGQLGSLSGTVALSNGASVLGALVIAVDPSTGTTIGGLASVQDGTYHLNHIPPGSYLVYAQPANGPVMLANIGSPGIAGANTTFRVTFAGGNQSPTSVPVTAGNTSQANISVDLAAGQMQIVFFGTGSPGGLDWTLSGGPKTAPSGGAIDLVLWGRGLGANITPDQIRLLGPGISLRQGTLHVDTNPSSVFQGYVPLRFTVDIAPVPSPTPVTVAVVNGTDAAAYSGGLVMLSAPPLIDAIKKVQNGASFVQGQAVAPGSFVAIFGSNFGSGLTLFHSIPLSTSLAGASVTFNGIPAPMIGVTAGQINAQLPWGVGSSGTAQVVVMTAAGSSAPVSIPLTSAAPGLFYIATDSSGVNRPGAYNNSDGTLPLPPGIVFPPYNSRPSKHGEVLVIFVTGLGAVTNQPADGAPGLAASPYSTTVGAPTVLVGGVPANVLFSGLSPQYPSFYQISITIPANAPTGNTVSLQIQMNGITTTDQLKIAVSN